MSIICRHPTWRTYHRCSPRCGLPRSKTLIISKVHDCLFYCKLIQALGSAIATASEVMTYLPRLKCAELGVTFLPWLVKHTTLERLSVHLPALESLTLLSIPSLASLPLLRTLALSREIYVCCDDDSFCNSLLPLSHLEELHLSVRPRADVPSTSFPSFPRLHTLSVCVNFPTIELTAISAANSQLTSLSFVTFVRAVETIRAECLSGLKRLQHLAMAAGNVSRYECFFEVREQHAVCLFCFFRCFFSCAST